MTPARPKCPQCRQPILLPQGPPKATVGMLFFQPLMAKDATTAKRVLSSELYQIGVNLPLVRSVSLWPHAPNSTDSVEKHLRVSLRAVKNCGVVLLFGTHVTTALLGEGISGILGLPQTSELLPGTVLLPAPSPEGVASGVLGEFRLIMQRLAKEIQKL